MSTSSSRQIFSTCRIMATLVPRTSAGTFVDLIQETISWNTSAEYKSASEAGLSMLVVEVFENMKVSFYDDAWDDIAVFVFSGDAAGLCTSMDPSLSASAAIAIVTVLATEVGQTLAGDDIESVNSLCDALMQCSAFGTREAELQLLDLFARLHCAQCYIDCSHMRPCIFVPWICRLAQRVGRGAGAS
jgi:hypothetical protein